MSRVKSVMLDAVWGCIVVSVLTGCGGIVLVTMGLRRLEKWVTDKVEPPVIGAQDSEW